jgi:hypothetical protein
MLTSLALYCAQSSGRAAVPSAAASEKVCADLRIVFDPSIIADGVF